MPNSRSIERLADALNVNISTDTYLRLVPQGIEPAIWAAGYAERCDGAKALKETTKASVSMLSLSLIRRLAYSTNDQSDKQ